MIKRKKSKNLKDSIAYYDKLDKGFKMVNEIRISNAYSTFQDLLNLKMPYFIYRQNYIKLRKSLNEYYSHPNILELSSIKRFRRQRMLIKDFHNVLASARVLAEFIDEDYLQDEFHCFMKELRNYIFHISHLPLISKWTSGRNLPVRYESIQREKFELYLNNQIEEHPKWKGLRLAINFLVRIEDSINLNEIFEQYNQKLIILNEVCLINYLKNNSEELAMLISSTEQVQLIFDELGARNSSPITRPRLRYLKYVLNKLG